MYKFLAATLLLTACVPLSEQADTLDVHGDSCAYATGVTFGSHNSGQINTDSDRDVFLFEDCANFPDIGFQVRATGGEPVEVTRRGYYGGCQSANYMGTYTVYPESGTVTFWFDPVAHGYGAVGIFISGDEGALYSMSVRN